MTETAIVQADPAQVLERVIISGDLSVMSPAERVHYYREVCNSLGLNPYTKPFDYLRLSGKLTLYTAKNGTDQLRRLYGVSVTNLEQSEVQGVYIVTAFGKDKDGRIDSAQGAVYIKNLHGEDLANAMMKAETKAKRRLTLSMCGLGFLDASDVDSEPEARRISVDHTTGEIVDEADIVRSADERVWQRYVHVLGEAQGLGIRVKPLRLPLERGVLTDEGVRLVQLIKDRRREVEPDELSEETQALLEDNKRLRDTLEELGGGVPKTLKADPKWTLGDIDSANKELQQRIDERKRDRGGVVLEGQVELPA